MGQRAENEQLYKQLTVGQNQESPLIVLRSCQSQFLQKLYSNVLKTYKGVLLILKCREWLLQLRLVASQSVK